GMQAVARLAEQVRAQRRPVSPDNPFLALERQVSDQIERALDGYRDARDRTSEALFEAIYGSPWVQAWLGLRAQAPEVRGRDDVYGALVVKNSVLLRPLFVTVGLHQPGVRYMF